MYDGLNIWVCMGLAGMYMYAEECLSNKAKSSKCAYEPVNQVSRVKSEYI